MFNFTKAKQEEKRKKKKKEEASLGLGKIKSFSHVFSNYYFWIIVTSGEEGIQNLVLFTKENNKCHYVIRLMAFYICVLFIYLLNFTFLLLLRSVDAHFCKTIPKGP